MRDVAAQDARAQAESRLARTLLMPGNEVVDYPGEAFMNFGNIGLMELFFLLLLCGLPLLLVVWFVRTVRAMSASLRDIGERVGRLERAVQEASTRRDG
jgi:hypothetical protein